MFLIGRQRCAYRCLKILRLSCVNFSNLTDLKNLNVVRTVEKTINSNTSIFIESPINVHLEPVDVNDPKAHDKLTMILYSRGKDTSDFQVKQTSKRLELFNKNTKPDKNDVCVIKVPYQLNVQVIATDDASVNLSKLEGGEFVVKAEKGPVTIADLKAQNIKVDCTEAEVNCNGRLQADNIELKTGLCSNIKCNNIMSNTFVVSTHKGAIEVNSCYSEKSHFTTLMGNMKLAHLHRSVQIDVIQEGNIQITSFSGNLQASLKSGDVYLLASQLTEKSSIFIHEKGKVQVLIPDILNNLPATNLIAEKIDVDDKIMKLGRFMDDSHPKRFRFEKEPSNELYIVCKNGSIELKENNKMPFM